MKKLFTLLILLAFLSSCAHLVLVDRIELIERTAKILHKVLIVDGNIVAEAIDKEENMRETVKVRFKKEFEEEKEDKEDEKR